MLRALALAVLAVVFAAAPGRADEALIAVAANFKAAAARIADDFEAATGHEATLVFGSTGHLYAQIVNGAPYDVLLAADQARPERLAAEGRAVAGSRFTYAVGRLTLWSPDPGRIGGDGAAVLRAGDFQRLALANPDLAPYGLAAEQTLTSLGLDDALQPKLVMGANVTQTFAFVRTGAAELGFVALSTVLDPKNDAPSSRWDPPQELYDPIRQDAVLLAHGKGNAAAAAFLAYLKTDAARAAMAELGYAAP